MYSTAGCYSRRSIRFTFIKPKVSFCYSWIVNLMQVKAYLDTVNRLLVGEEHPFRFIEEEKKGFPKNAFLG